MLTGVCAPRIPPPCASLPLPPDCNTESYCSSGFFSLMLMSVFSALHTNASWPSLLLHALLRYALRFSLSLCLDVPFLSLLFSPSLFLTQTKRHFWRGGPTGPWLWSNRTVLFPWSRFSLLASPRSVLTGKAESCWGRGLGDGILDSLSPGLIDSMLKLSGVITIFAAFKLCDAVHLHLFLGENCLCPFLHAMFCSLFLYPRMVCSCWCFGNVAWSFNSCCDGLSSIILSQWGCQSFKPSYVKEDMRSDEWTTLLFNNFLLKSFFQTFSHKQCRAILDINLFTQSARL